jgi:hypothetical protein
MDWKLGILDAHTRKGCFLLCWELHTLVMFHLRCINIIRRTTTITCIGSLQWFLWQFLQLNGGAVAGRRIWSATWWRPRTAWYALHWPVIIMHVKNASLNFAHARYSALGELEGKMYCGVCRAASPRFAYAPGNQENEDQTMRGWGWWCTMLVKGSVAGGYQVLQGAGSSHAFPSSTLKYMTIKLLHDIHIYDLDLRTHITCKYG